LKYTKKLILIKYIFPVFLIFIVFPCCLTAQAAKKSPGEANVLSQGAARNLDAAIGGNSDGSIRQTTVTAPAEFTSGGRQPAWVSDPYTVYRKDVFLAAVGSGSNRDEAAAKAYVELISQFSRSVKSEYTVAVNYTEALKRGAVSVSNDTTISDRIITAASMDNLIGAQIGNVWDSKRGAVYAAAYLDIERTISIYTDFIIFNCRNIDMLTSMTAAEKNTLDGYARYRLASLIAGINANFAGIVNFAGGSTSQFNLKTPESYNLEAAGIIRNITVIVRVSGDRADRIQNAFAQALGSEGIRTRGNNPYYVLDVDVVTSEVMYPAGNNDYKWCRIELNANLIEISSGASLLVFVHNNRIGHTTYDYAENVAFMSAEKDIAETYTSALRKYLASLIPAN